MNLKKAELLTEDSVPDPEYLIKSIAEQGYSLETSLADLIDNSISAGADKIEILINVEEEPFELFLTDNGKGMSEGELKENMKFPSNSPLHIRSSEDLGRFGLGMKTASFAQTRKLTVLSRPQGTQYYSARTWDVEYLTKTKQWKILLNSEDEIQQYLTRYLQLSKGFLNEFFDYLPNTIIVWTGLYKYEEFIDVKNRRSAIQHEIHNITNEHLSIVFHRFMERKKDPLKIRVNNMLLEPFNPFPVHNSDFRSIPYKQRHLENDIIRIEGFVLPSRSVVESRSGNSSWTTRNRSLMDMEGIYIYRSDRLIRFGGWNGIIKKNSKLQLARLMVEVGNSADHLLHLNVAKSQITIPYELKIAFFNYIELLTKEAVKELYNINIGDFPQKKRNKKPTLFEKKATVRGMLLRLNEDFPILKELRASLNKTQISSLNLLLKMLETRINKIRMVHESESFTGDAKEDAVTEQELLTSIGLLKAKGYSTSDILEYVVPQLGFSIDSLPNQVKLLLSHE